MADLAMMETVWHERTQFEEAEIAFHEHQARLKCGSLPSSSCTSATKVTPCHVSSVSGTANLFFVDLEVLLDALKYFFIQCRAYR